MDCGIMRVEKRRRVDVPGIQSEANRTLEQHLAGLDFDDSDIDWTKTDDNVHLVHTDNWSREITRQIKEAGIKPRKDATVLLDALYTSSGHFFATRTEEEWMDYFRQCLDFHIREYCMGDPSRVINAVIHLDEKEPHMAVASVPLYQDEAGKMHLSAKDLLGGHSDFRKHQDRFYEQVSKSFGLARGEIKDKAERKRHTTKREWQRATLDYEVGQRQRDLDALTLKMDEIRTSTEKLKEEHAEIKKEHSRASEELEHTLERQVAAARLKKNPLNRKETYDKDMLDQLQRIAQGVARDNMQILQLGADAEQLMKKAKEMEQRAQQREEISKRHYDNAMDLESNMKQRVSEQAHDMIKDYLRATGQEQAWAKFQRDQEQQHFHFR